MKRRFFVPIFMALVSTFILLTACGKRTEKPMLLPSEASTHVFDSVMVLVGKGEITTEAQFNAARNKLSASIIERVKSDSLQGESLLEYGQLLYWSGKDQKARRIFENMRGGKDTYASAAWKELISMDIEAEGYAKAEASMKEYRAAFPPDTSDLAYLFNQCSTLCDRYSEANQLEAAIRVCMDELNALPPNAPYRSFFLGTSIVPLMMETGRIEEGRAILDTFRTKLQAALALQQKSAPSESAAGAEDSLANGLKAYIEHYSSLLAQLDLVGTKAPGFKFLHVYNADSTLTLEEFKGKVVMIDFWATWCTPCVVAYAEARRIYKDYKDKGLEIVGITSFQGTYKGMDSGISEGTEDQPLDEKREIELTESYIKKHGIVWPCAFSDRPVFDPSYGIKGIPTFVLLDRAGIIRFIQTGIGQEKQKRRVIDRLIKS